MEQDLPSPQNEQNEKRTSRQEKIRKLGFMAAATVFTYSAQKAGFHEPLISMMKPEEAPLFGIMPFFAGTVFDFVRPNLKARAEEQRAKNQEAANNHQVYPQ